MEKKTADTGEGAFLGYFQTPEEKKKTAQWMALFLAL